MNITDKFDNQGKISKALNPPIELSENERHFIKLSYLSVPFIEKNIKDGQWIQIGDDKYDIEAGTYDADRLMNYIFSIQDGAFEIDTSKTILNRYYVYLTVNDTNGYYSVKVQNLGGKVVTLSNDLLALLGYDADTRFLDGVTKSLRPNTLTDGITNFYVKIQGAGITSYTTGGDTSIGILYQGSFDCSPDGRKTVTSLETESYIIGYSTLKNITLTLCNSETDEPLTFDRSFADFTLYIR